MPNKSASNLAFFLDILLKLEELEIPYVIIGGFAAAMYGTTRATFDIDMVVNMGETHIRKLADAYPSPRYYADPYQMRNAIRIGSSFNIIDAELGEKADLFPLTMDPRYIPAFENRVRHTVSVPNTPPFQVWAARPEDVIVGKLMAWAEGRSDRHVSDIFEMMLFHYLGGQTASADFDEESVLHRAQELGEDVADLWQLLNDTAHEQASRS